jgi:hypothetical protein
MEKMINWNEAEQHLRTCEAAYAEIGSAGYIVLTTVIQPLRDRFNKGERTVELHEEIMGISL